jgi:hypothetical protein
MEISTKNQLYLKMIEDIYEVSNSISTKTYIWGGMTIDIVEGVFLREHGDLDGFIYDMTFHLENLTEKYQQKGYIVKYDNDFNMLIIENDIVHASFNELNIENGVAMWRHIGRKGTIYFPEIWLDNDVKSFYSSKVFISGSRFEFALKCLIPHVNPEWKEREKDIQAKDYWTKILDNLNIDKSKVLKNIWSYNPFWITKGYNAFKEPVLVSPGSI